MNKTREYFPEDKYSDTTINIGRLSRTHCNLLVFLAKCNVSGAQVKAGRMYTYGEGVKENHKEAVKWYKKAIGNHSVMAKYWLGYMYQWGQGVKQDRKKAAEWWIKAADQGHLTSQWYLGSIYRDGKYVDQNHEKAIHYWTLAAKQGHELAEYCLKSRYNITI